MTKWMINCNIAVTNLKKKKQVREYLNLCAYDAHRENGKLD